MILSKETGPSETKPQTIGLLELLQLVRQLRQPAWHRPLQQTFLLILAMQGAACGGLPSGRLPWACPHPHG